MNRTQIFSGLEDRYQKYRPAYPAQSLDLLHAVVETGRDDSWPELPSLIDVGAGTGILTRQQRTKSWSRMSPPYAQSGASDDEHRWSTGLT